MEEVNTRLCVVSDPAKHAVKTVGDIMGRVSSKKAFQATLTTLEELRPLSSDIKRGTFTKKQLSTVEDYKEEENPQHYL